MPERNRCPNCSSPNITDGNCINCGTGFGGGAPDVPQMPDGERFYEGIWKKLDTNDDWCQSGNRREFAVRYNIAYSKATSRRDDEIDEGRKDFLRLSEEYRNDNDAVIRALWGAIICEYRVRIIDRIINVNQTRKITAVADNPLCKELRQRVTQTYGTDNERHNNLLDIIGMAHSEMLDVAEDPEAYYDVFLCCKQSDPQADYQPDENEIAQELYSILKCRKIGKRKIRVFYSQKSVRPGQRLAPRIFHAVCNSSIMAVLSSRLDYTESIWVKEEWSTFLTKINENQQKIIIPYAIGDSVENVFPTELAQTTGRSKDYSSMGFGNNPRAREIAVEIADEIISDLKALHKSAKPKPTAPIIAEKKNKVATGNAGSAPPAKAAQAEDRQADIKSGVAPQSAGNTVYRPVLHQNDGAVWKYIAGASRANGYYFGVIDRNGRKTLYIDLDRVRRFSFSCFAEVHAFGNEPPDVFLDTGEPDGVLKEYGEDYEQGRYIIRTFCCGTAENYRAAADKVRRYFNTFGQITHSGNNEKFDRVAACATAVVLDETGTAQVFAVVITEKVQGGYKSLRSFILEHTLPDRVNADYNAFPVKERWHIYKEVVSCLANMNGRGLPHGAVSCDTVYVGNTLGDMTGVLVRGMSEDCVLGGVVAASEAARRDADMLRGFLADIMQCSYDDHIGADGTIPAGWLPCEPSLRREIMAELGIVVDRADHDSESFDYILELTNDDGDVSVQNSSRRPLAEIRLDDSQTYLRLFTDAHSIVKCYRIGGCSSQMLYIKYRGQNNPPMMIGEEPLALYDNSQIICKKMKMIFGEKKIYSVRLRRRN